MADRGETDSRLIKVYNDNHSVVRLPCASDLPKNWLAGSKTPPTDHLFLVDLPGNLMMQFSKDPDPKKVCTGTTRLLKYPRIG